MGSGLIEVRVGRWGVAAGNPKGKSVICANEHITSKNTTLDMSWSYKASLSILFTNNASIRVHKMLRVFANRYVQLPRTLWQGNICYDGRHPCRLKIK